MNKKVKKMLKEVPVGIGAGGAFYAHQMELNPRVAAERLLDALSSSESCGVHTLRRSSFTYYYESDTRWNWHSFMAVPTSIVEVMKVYLNKR